VLFTHDELIHFLLHAKHRTYAGQNDEASMTPLLPGSKQFEYREAPFFYRDIYFGMAYFSGQEVVYHRDHPVWSLNYTGGVISDITNPAEIRRIYAFLREALRLVAYERPFRGPQMYRDGQLRYLDATQGDITRFQGEEMILQDNKRIYSLRYSGGLLG
jgi:Domain of unknown function (DUF5680)